MSTAVSVSVCCGNRAPVLSPPSGTTTARIWWAPTFRKEGKEGFWKPKAVVTDGVMQTIKIAQTWYVASILIISSTIRPPLAYLFNVTSTFWHGVSYILLFLCLGFSTCCHSYSFAICKKVRRYLLSVIFKIVILSYIIFVAFLQHTSNSLSCYWKGCYTIIGHAARVSYKLLPRPVQLRYFLSLHPRVLHSLYPGSGCLAWALCARRPWLCRSRLAAAAPPLPSTLQDTPSSTAQPTPSTSSSECWPCASPRTGLVESHRDRSKEGKYG